MLFAKTGETQPIITFVILNLTKMLFLYPVFILTCCQLITFISKCSSRSFSSCHFLYNLFFLLCPHNFWPVATINIKTAFLFYFIFTKNDSDLVKHLIFIISYTVNKTQFCETFRSLHFVYVNILHKIPAFQKWVSV